MSGIESASSNPEITTSLASSPASASHPSVTSVFSNPTTSLMPASSPVPTTKPISKPISKSKPNTPMTTIHRGGDLPAGVDPAASDSVQVSVTSKPRTDASTEVKNTAEVKTTASGSRASSGGRPTSGAKSSTKGSVPVGVQPTPTTKIEHIAITGTSTITDTPESTLAKPSFIPTVVDGRVSLVAPPVLTILSTSGSVVFTHVIANPTGIGQTLQDNKGGSTFFRNEGAVAAVFVVVGGVFTALLAFGLYRLCRRRRRSRHERWIAGIPRHRPLSETSQDPFQDPQIPQMRTISSHGHILDTDIPHQTPLSDDGHDALGLYDMEPMRQYEHPMNPPEPHTGIGSNEIGLAITTDHLRPSTAQSSPSIYPPSLPPQGDDTRFPEEEISQPRRYSYSSDTAAPPRPRRSHLRDLPIKTQLVTPPSSDSSHSPVSATFYQSDSTVSRQGSISRVIGRPTLLNVRPQSRSYNDDGQPRLPHAY